MPASVSVPNTSAAADSALPTMRAIGPGKLPSSMITPWSTSGPLRRSITLVMQGPTPSTFGSLAMLAGSR